jgi:hypothetical protein
MITVLQKLLRFVAGLARELADETAYQRHLAVTSSPHSGNEWRKFIDSRLSRKYQTGKCC